jgi:Fe2+ or Zn2+ uptake regulation protein
MSTTIQSKAVMQALYTLGHATNQDLHEQVIKQLPSVSATTVHRITTRLIENKEIGYAPSNGKAVMLDAKSSPHDHFVCKGCGGMKDITLSNSVFKNIQEQLGKNIVENELVIYGICVDCSNKATPMP